MDEIALQIYNTETRKKERITLAQKKEKIHMYTCGPTLYHFAHIGNFRTYVFEDLLSRTITYFGMPLFHVMNLTDVDDKTIEKALEKKVSLKSYTQIYKEAFFEDLKTLNIRPAKIYPAATDYIDEMIKMIETLLAKGSAYRGRQGDIFFSIRAFPSYGRLSHLQIESLKAGASERVSRDEYGKEAVADFVLWKHYDPKRDGEVFWESPFGRGRPGWHIECSAMATKLLGESIDIHVGGVDNIFPHHENEIAQSESCSGKHFVRYWIHAEHLIVDGKKMSKSVGNFYTLRALLEKGYRGPEVRYLLLSTHYRTQLNFTFEGLEGARRALIRFGDFIYRLKGLSKGVEDSFQPYLDHVRKAFKQKLGDDLNISSGLGVLFEMLRELNSECDAHRVGERGAGEILAFLCEINTLLGVLPLEEHLEIPLAVQEAFEKRQKARAVRDWAESDRQRERIDAQGYVIEDGPQGSRLKKK